jgi:hypothetical protein
MKRDDVEMCPFRNIEIVYRDVTLKCPHPCFYYGACGIAFFHRFRATTT